MPSPLAEAFLMGILNSCYETPSKIRKIFELCKCGAKSGDEKKKDTGYPSRCPTTKSTIKIILTAIPYAKLAFYPHLHNRITTR